MKLKCKVLVVLAMAVLSLSSCTLTEDGMSLTTKPSNSTILFENPYKFIGQLHNDALDSVKVQGIRKDQLKGFTRDFTQRHFAQMSEFLNLQQEENGGQNAEISINRGFEIGKRINEAKTRATIDELSDSLIMAFPIEGQKYIVRMYEICDEEESDTVKICQNFSKLDYSITTDTTVNDTLKHALLATSAIAKATNIYNANETMTRGATASSLAKSDLGGAIMGIIGRGVFVKAAFSGLVFGPSGIVCCFAREAVRGAIVSSAFHLASGGVF